MKRSTVPAAAAEPGQSGLSSDTLSGFPGERISRRTNILVTHHGTFNRDVSLTPTSFSETIMPPTYRLNNASIRNFPPIRNGPKQ
jgi:hypothetical protein